MKKIMLLMVLLGAVALAGVKAKVIASSVALVITGALFLPPLMVGDAQWQGYTNDDKCDNQHIIYSVAPQLKDGVLGKIKFAVPCDEWYEYNRGEK